MLHWLYKWMAASFLVLAAGFGLVDALLWHPGYSRVDEMHTLVRVQLCREGAPLLFKAFAGSLHNSVLLVASWFAPGLAPLRAMVWLVLLMEGALLWAVARRHFGAVAAGWAVMASAGAAFTLVRGHALLSWSFLPVELLGLWWLMPRCQSWARSAVLGFLAGCMLLDYEAWLLGTPVLLGLWRQEKEGRRPGFWAMLAGWLIAAGLVFALTPEFFSSWMAVRSNHSAPNLGPGLWAVAMANFKAFVLGGLAVPYFGAQNHPVFPLWAWPGLLAGLGLAFKKHRWLLLWAGFGLLPLALRSPGLEPNRAIVAWPALCLTAGLGFAWAYEKLQGVLPLAAWLLLLLPWLGLGFEAQAYVRSMRQSDQGLYALSLAKLQAVRDLKASGQPVGMLTELGLESGADMRLLAGPGLLPRPGAVPVAMIPDDLIPVFGPKGIQAAGQPVAYTTTEEGFWLLFPNAAWSPRLAGVQNMLLPYWRVMPPLDKFGLRARSEEWMGRLPAQDPWARTVLMGQVLYGALETRTVDAALARQVLAEPLVSGRFLNLAGYRLARRDPDLALAFLQRAAQIDSRLAISPQVAQDLQQFKKQLNR
jgi:hypothetical protein